MIHHIAKLVLCVAIVTAVPLATHAQDGSTSICAAFASKNYNKALALTKEAFAKIKSAAEASALIKAVLACTPPDQLGAVVVTAIEANPALGEAILEAALSGASRDEQLAILSAVNFALSQNAGAFGSLLAFVSNLLSSVEGATPTSSLLTNGQVFNPANFNSGTVSPSTPGTP
jgi:hypothetical protein